MEIDEYFLILKTDSEWFEVEPVWCVKILGVSGSYGSPEFIDRQQGLISSPSFVPHYVSGSNMHSLVTVHQFYDQNFEILNFNIWLFCFC